MLARARRYLSRAVQTWTARVSLALVTIVAGVLCFVPGFNALNYYSALATAAVGGILAGLSGAAAAFKASHAAGDPDVRVTRPFADAALAAALLALVPLLLLSLNAFRVKNCDLFEGVLFYLVGPGISILFASQMGAVCGLLARKGWHAPVFFGLLWLAWAFRDLWHFYNHPAIFAYNPFVGFVSGAVYDDVINLDERLLLFRLSNLVWLGAFWALAVMAWRPLAEGATRRLDLRLMQRAPRRAWIILGTCMLGWAVLYGARGLIGYEISREHIEATLGGRVENERIVLFYDRGAMSTERALQLLEDHAWRLDQIEERLGDRYPRQIRSYVYRNNAQKRALMGAGRVYIAKPWMDEIHLGPVHYGHPVIGHELAHVVLGHYAGGLLGVPTAWGVLPHVVMVEGAAEAFEWDTGRLTPHQWSAAMRAEKIAPSMETLIGPDGFWSQSARKAYTLSGSFVRWLLDTRGPEPFKAAYKDADFEGAYGVPLSQLVGEWEAFVDAIELPPDAQALARQAFDKKGIFHRVCPLEIARLEDEARTLYAAGLSDEALEIYRTVVGFWPSNPRKYLPIMQILAREGRAPEVAKVADEVLALEATNAVQRARVKELIGDARWRAGDLEGAAAAYLEIAKAPQSEDRKRTVLVKLDILSDPEREPILGPYLLGSGGDDVEYLAGALADLPDDELVLYLLGRRLYDHSRTEEAVGVLTRAIEAYAGDDSDVGVHIARESWRLLAHALFFTGRYARAEEAFVQTAELVPHEGTRIRMLDWAARCRWRAKQ